MSCVLLKTIKMVTLFILNLLMATETQNLEKTLQVEKFQQKSLKKKHQTKATYFKKSSLSHYKLHPYSLANVDEATAIALGAL